MNKAAAALLRNMDATGAKMATCKNCHQDYEYVLGRCPYCISKYMKNWKKKNGIK
jgi:hypothetical protein